MQSTSLSTLEMQRNNLEDAIGEKRKEVNIKLREDNKWLIRMLDICMAIIIISNVFALLLTNVMVAQQPNFKVAESNPVTAETQGLERHPDWFPNLAGFLLHMGFLSILFVVYLWNRNNITTRYSLRLMTYIYGSVAVIFLFDFINNIGYFIGGLI